MKKVKKSKNAILTHSSTSKESETTILVITQSQKSLPAYTLNMLAKIKWYISGPNKKKNYLNPKVTYL
jgi:hypothetical protein